MPAVDMMGHSAGASTVQSIKIGQYACELDVEQMVMILNKNGLYLTQEKLSKKMTR